MSYNSSKPFVPIGAQSGQTPPPTSWKPYLGGFVVIAVIVIAVVVLIMKRRHTTTEEEKNKTRAPMFPIPTATPYGK